MLDLAFAGNAAVDVAQLLGIHALVVKPLPQLAAQPAFEHVLAQLQLVQQRLRRRLARERFIVAADTVVREAHAKVSAIHPLGNLVVVLVIDQQRQREAAQHALDGTLPALLFRADLDQLADERQRRLGNAGFLGQARAQLLHRRRDVGGRALHRFEFRTDFAETALVIALAAEALADRIVQRRRGTLAVLQFVLRTLDKLGEAVCVVRQVSPQLLRGQACLLALGLAAIALRFRTALLAFQFLDAFAALLAALQFQFGQPFGVVVERRAALGFFAKQAAITYIHLAQARFDQCLAAAFAEAVDTQLQRFVVAATAVHFLQVVVVGTRRRAGFPPGGGR